MLKALLKYSFTIAAIFLAACSDNDSAKSIESDSDEISSITITRSPRYAPSDLDTTDPDIITVSDFEEGSVIYISQLGTTVDPDFTSTSTNLYPYIWNGNNDATWDEYYNFESAEDAKPITWKTIRANGQVGNSFSLYGMYFPVKNQIRFNVETDQTMEENFLVSDILGAYHATSSLYSRLRFRFFHLMTYLRVTLYVPTYEIENDKSTGFEANALLAAYMINPATVFSINWRANRSSDTEGPLVEIPSNASRSNITMFQHLVSDEPTTIDVRSYYANGELEEDEVRTYEFSVIFPPQSFNGDILCFRLQTPGQQNNDGDNQKYVSYYFSASQLTTDSGDFRFTQGTLQRLLLYLPRLGNNTVLVGANIIDWTDASTGMTVVDQTQSNPGTGEDNSGDNGEGNNGGEENGNSENINP